MRSSVVTCDHCNTPIDQARPWFVAIRLWLRPTPAVGGDGVALVRVQTAEDVGILLDGRDKTAGQRVADLCTDRCAGDYARGFFNRAAVTGVPKSWTDAGRD